MGSVLKLVVSRPATCLARPSPELRMAVATTVAERFRGMWVPADIGAAGVVELLSEHVAQVRGFRHPDDVAAIVAEALALIADRETTAAAAFRRPPRRRRPRVAPAEQLAFQFVDAA